MVTDPVSEAQIQVTRHKICVDKTADEVESYWRLQAEQQLERIAK